MAKIIVIISIITTIAVKHTCNCEKSLTQHSVTGIFQPCNILSVKSAYCSLVRSAKSSKTSKSTD